MSSLQARLDRMRASSAAKMPPEALAVMHRATEDLEGAVALALGEGAQMPRFTLPKENGEPVALADLLARGPVVATFFRGHW